MKTFVLFMVMIGADKTETINIVTGESWLSKYDCNTELTNYKHLENKSIKFYCATDANNIRGLSK